MKAVEMNLSRAVLIFLSKDGVFQYARKGTAQHAKLLKIGYLACASVPTLKDAEQLQTATCKLSYDGSLWRYPMDGTLEGLELAGRNLEILYLHRKSGARGWPQGWPLGGVMGGLRELAK